MLQPLIILVASSIGPALPFSTSQLLKAYVLHKVVPTCGDKGPCEGERGTELCEVSRL